MNINLTDHNTRPLFTQCCLNKTLWLQLRHELYLYFPTPIRDSNDFKYQPGAEGDPLSPLTTQKYPKTQKYLFIIIIFLRTNICRDPNTFPAGECKQTWPTHGPDTITF